MTLDGNSQTSLFRLELLELDKQTPFLMFLTAFRKEDELIQWKRKI